MDASDVELESENSLTSSPRPPRKNITLKLKGEKSSSGRGRPRKSKNKADDQDHASADDEVLETPIFKTMDPGEVVHHNKKLKWDNKVNLIGEKVVDPLIHCCGICSLPILIYGRMIQCKHVFCFTCAKKTEKSCPRCGDPVQRIEQSALGTVFLCTYGGSKHGTNGCRRTYLSQRDLNAHIGHRHLKSEMKDQGSVKTISPAQIKSGLNAGAVAPSHQALIDQFNAAVRQVSKSMPQQQRPAQDAYIPGQVAGLPHSLSASIAQPGMPQQAYPPGTVLQSMAALSTSQAALSQSVIASSAANQESYSSIPVVGSRISTLISVPIQDNDYAKKLPQQQQSYAPSHASGSATMPTMMNFPPPVGFPVGSMAPNLHQQVPHPGPPPMFSSQGHSTGLAAGPASSFNSPPLQMLSTGPPRGPPRMTAPPGQPPPRFFDSQGVPPRGPWTGVTGPPSVAPRGPSGLPQPHQARPPQRADYNYY